MNQRSVNQAEECRTDPWTFGEDEHDGGGEYWPLPQPPKSVLIVSHSYLRSLQTKFRSVRAKARMAHSLRSAIIGSMLVTRRADTRHAIKAVAASTKETVKNVNGSVGSTAKR